MSERVMVSPVNLPRAASSAVRSTASGMFTGVSPPAGITVTATSSLPVAPSSSVTVRRNVNIVSASVSGAVNLAVAVDAPRSDTSGPAVCVHA